MAVFNVPNYLAKDGFGMSLNIRRGNPNPLDNSSVWASLAEAQNYAKTDPVAYVGQILTVVTDVVVDEVTVKTATAYVIDNEAGDLKEVGSSPVGDEKSITVAEDGTVSLYGIAGLALTREEEDGSTTNITYQPLLVNGKLTWVEPSATTVEGLATEIEGLKTRISALETTVGKAAEGENDATGLVKSVADNAAAIAKNAEDIAAEVTARENADKTNADAIDAVEAKIGEVAEGKTIVEMISDAQTAATYDDTALAGRVSTNETNIKANTDAIDAIEADYLKAADKTELQDQITSNKNAIDKLNGDSTVEGSVDKKVTDAINEFATRVSDDGTINTIAELINYVSTHGGEATEMASAIDELETKVGEKSVAVQIEEAIAAENLAQYATDDELTAVADRVTAVEGKAHEHANKDLLDTYTQTEENLADAVAKKHEHANATVLDGITAEKVAAWDEAEKNVIASVDEAQFGVDTDRKLTLLDIAIGKVTGLQDALDSKANKGTTLAEYGITDAYTKTETEARIQEVLDGLSDTSETAASVSQALETYKTSNDQRVDTIEGKLSGIAEGAQVNVLEAIKINGVAQTITDKAVNIPVATDTLLGVVMGSTAENKIAVAADGTMEINSVNVNKLVQDENTALILNGGSASV